jgi:hypothetical protein
VFLFYSLLSLLYCSDFCGWAAKIGATEFEPATIKVNGLT